VTRPRADALVLSYILTGTTRDLRIPPIAATGRVDELWKHTCFEAFMRAQTGDSYYEFNVSPSTAWVAYQFTGHRTGMCPASAIRATDIHVESDTDSLQVQATLELDRLADLPGDVVWRLALSAVIEDANGQKSYWALAHPPGAPDFHHRDGFTLELHPAEHA